MRRASRNWFVIGLISIGTLAGCSDTQTSKSLSDERKGALEELGFMLKSLPDEGRKPPTKLAELEPVEPMVPTAGPAIRNGTIIYIWGVGFAAGRTDIVAYEKDVAQQGGYVLLQDGTVKKMTASEFQSAPKAKK